MESEKGLRGAIFLAVVIVLGAVGLRTCAPPKTDSPSSVLSPAPPKPAPPLVKGPLTPPRESRIAVSVLTSATNMDQIALLADDFNHHQPVYFLDLLPALETRHALHDMLAGADKPVVWIASTHLLAKRFDEAYKQKFGKRILNSDAPDTFRIFASQPMVFLVKTEKLLQLRPMLEAENPWTFLREGRTRYAFPNPVDSSGGTLALGMVLWGCAHLLDPKAEADLTKLIGTKELDTFLRAVKQGGCLNTEDGSRSLTQQFAEGLINNGDCDFIITYASSAEKAVGQFPGRFAVVYPKRSVFARHTAAILQDAPREQQAGGKEFLAYVTKHFQKTSIPQEVRPIELPAFYPWLNRLEERWNATPKK